MMKSSNKSTNNQRKSMKVGGADYLLGKAKTTTRCIATNHSNGRKGVRHGNENR